MFLKHPQETDVSQTDVYTKTAGMTHNRCFSNRCF